MLQLLMEPSRKCGVPIRTGGREEAVEHSEGVYLRPGDNLRSSRLPVVNLVNKVCLLEKNVYTPSLIGRPAARDQMNEIYNITRAIAPRQRRERVRIRAADGAMLAPRGQFQAIASYFQQAFQAPEPFRFSTSAPAPGITAEMLVPAVLSLKSRKAVPVNSVPPEVWKACAQPFACRLAEAYSEGVRSCPSQLPEEMMHCSLTLLPKPGKAMRTLDL